MAGSQLYLPSTLPQWEIFAGFVLFIIGYVDKKNLWTRLGWILLIITGLTALYFNLSWHYEISGKDESNAVWDMLKMASWQAVAGGVLAMVSLLMFNYNKKRYRLLSILTLVYFVLTFILFYQISRKLSGSSSAKPQTEQTH